LQPLAKNAGAKATGAHVSLVGHCTAEELRRYLSTTQAASGFGNRILWVCCRRSKCLPEGGQVDSGKLHALGRRLADALKFARSCGELRRDDGARAVWLAVYEELSEGRPGLAGALLGRGEAHVMRLAMLYALLDKSELIRAEHLAAALALWQYATQSVEHVFGDSLGDPLADDLLRLLRAAPNGLSRTDVSNYLGRNQSAQ